MMQTGDTELIRAINRFHVLDAIRRFEPTSRAEIGEHTLLSRSTVSAIIAVLLEEGVVSYDDGEAPVAAGRGRPRTMLRMNPNAAYVVGAKLAMHQVSITVTNLRADPLSSLVLPIRTWRLGAEVIADLLEDGIRAAVAKAGITMAELAGIGVGLPGFIDATAGISYWSPILGPEPKPIPFAAMLAGRLNVPTVIENDANLITLAERWFGHGQDIDNFVVVTVEAGIGMGLFINGDLYRGHHNIGTEFGHSKVDRQGPLCRCGQSGCIEAFTADYALLREARKIIDLPPTDDERASDAAVQEITRLARAGHAGLKEIFEQAGATLGLGIANLINIIDPGRVIISGAGMRAADLLEPSLVAAVSANSLKALSGRCQIIFHDWTDEVWARGAASLVLQGLYRTPWTRNSNAPVAL